MMGVVRAMRSADACEGRAGREMYTEQAAAAHNARNWGDSRMVTQTGGARLGQRNDKRTYRGSLHGAGEGTKAGGPREQNHDTHTHTHTGGGDSHREGCTPRQQGTGDEVVDGHGAHANRCIQNG